MDRAMKGEIEMDNERQKKEIKMSLFEKLNKVDVNKHKKKKGQFDYLSWPLAIQELLKVCPKATWEVHEYGNGQYRHP